MKEYLPLVSIIIPVYNMEAFLSKCLDSVLAQTYQDIEVLLIDDGSKDSSGIICDAYQEKDMRVRVFHLTNGGVSAARNYGIEQALGEFLCFLPKNLIALSPVLCYNYLNACFLWRNRKIWPE